MIKGHKIYPGKMLKFRQLASFAKRAAETASITTMANLPIWRGKRHGLAAEVVVSLTSYPPRFSTLHLTLRTLLRQSVRPDRLILWIAREDIKSLPAKVRNLERDGVEIRQCEDLRSFKKIIPALEAFPEAIIVTADDDLYYDREWLADLLATVRFGALEVVCHRASRFPTSSLTMPLLSEWVQDVTDFESTKPSRDLVLSSGAGAVFAPRVLHADVLNRLLFNELTPMCDDTWLAWMIFRTGATIRTSGRPRSLRAWSRTNRGSLYVENQAGRMDIYLSAMAARYGPLHLLKA